MTGPENPEIAAALAGLTRTLEPIQTGLAPGGKLQRPVAAVLFDIYGTLLISASGDISAFGRKTEGGPAADPSVTGLLQKLGVDTDPEDLYDRFIDAIRAAHARRKNEGADYPEVAVDEIWAFILNLDDPREARPFALTFETAANPVFPMPRAMELLARVRETGLPAGIISNAQFYTELILEFFLGDLPEASWAHPDLIFYSYRFGYAKPSLYLFKKAVAALGRLGISAGHTLYVGNDMLNDIFPARVCGFQTALFAGDDRSLRLRSDDDRLVGIQPDLIITDLAQLEAHLFQDCRRL